MTLKVQRWRPDTHPGHIIELEWEYDPDTGRDTGREHRCVSYRYPDGTHIHRDTHGVDVAQEHFKKLLCEHVTKNRAVAAISDLVPPRMKKPVFDRDGDAVLDDAGRPRRIVKDKHMPQFLHLGDGRYEFVVPGIDEATHRALAGTLSKQFGDKIVLLKPDLVRTR